VKREREKKKKRTDHRSATLALSLTYARQVDFFFFGKIKLTY
jgi:hypothetical protein